MNLLTDRLLKTEKAQGSEAETELKTHEEGDRFPSDRLVLQ